MGNPANEQRGKEEFSIGHAQCPDKLQDERMWDTAKVNHMCVVIQRHTRFESGANFFRC